MVLDVWPVWFVVSKGESVSCRDTRGAASAALLDRGGLIGSSRFILRGVDGSD